MSNDLARWVADPVRELPERAREPPAPVRGGARELPDQVRELPEQARRPGPGVPGPGQLPEWPGLPTTARKNPSLVLFSWARPGSTYVRPGPPVSASPFR